MGNNLVMEKEVLIDQEIIYILKNRKILLDAIQRKMEQMYANIESLDEIIKRISIKPIIYDDEKSFTGSGSGGLDHILLKRDTEHKRQLEDQQQAVLELIREEEKIYRVFQCLARLSADNYELLDALYVKGYTWDYYASKNEISLSTLGRKKRKALDNLRKLYESSL